MEQAPNIDIGKLSHLRASIDKLGEQRKVIKGQLDEIEVQAVDALMRLGVRFIDESGQGAGPFWVLGKQKNDGSWSHDRYIEFFGLLMVELQKQQLTPEQCATLAQTYLKQYEKRRLVLNKLLQARQKGVEDLRLWLEKGDDA
jgi:hypothetical protein